LEIVDHRLHVAVADDVHPALGVANRRGAELDRLDHALRLADFDDVPDQVDVLEQDEEARDDVVDQRLCAEADDQPARPPRPGRASG
jgi:hypothetical protein